MSLKSIVSLAFLLVVGLMVLAAPVSAGLTIATGPKITSWDGTTWVNITVTGQPMAQDGTITIDTWQLYQCVADGPAGFFKQENVIVSDTAGNGTVWTGTVDGATGDLTLTSTNGPTAIGESVRVTFTGAGGNPWWTGVAGEVTYSPLTVTRTDTAETSSFDFILDLPLGDDTVTGGARITGTTGATSYTLRFTRAPFPRDYTITIDVTNLDPLVASGTFSTDNIVVSSTDAHATWTGVVDPGPPPVLILTSTNSYTGIGGTVRVTFTGAGGTPWIGNTGGPRTVNLIATRTDTGETDTLRFLIETAPAPGTSTANTNIAGLTAATAGGIQTVTVDTALLPAGLIPNNSVLEIHPPADRGWKNITIYALDGTGFTRTGNLIIGHPTLVHLVSEDIAPPAGFSAGIGPAASFSYSIDLPAYLPDAVLATTLWQGPVSPYNAQLLQTAAGNVPPASVLGTAYTARVTRTNFPPGGTARINMSLDSNWQNQVGPQGGNSGTTLIWRVSDDGGTGQIFPTRLLFTDAAKNLDYFEAESPLGLSAFGISSFSGNNNPFQLVALAVAEHVEPQPASDQGNPSPVAEPGKEAGKGTASQPNPQQNQPPVNPAPPATKSVDLYINDKGVVTQATVLEAEDRLATVSIGQGVTALDSHGTPLSSVSITAVPAGNLPALPGGNAISFAGRAYDLRPDGATFSPAVTISFPAPSVLFGQEFTVKTYDPATRSWQDIPTVYNSQTGMVTAQVSHLCCFALFATTSGTGTVSTPAPEPTKPAPGGSASGARSATETFVGIVMWAADQAMKNPMIVSVILILAVVIFLFYRKRRRDSLLFLR